MRGVRLAFLGSCLFVFFMASSLDALAQPGDPPPPSPITGIEILVAMGGLLGIKKIRDFRKKKD